MRSWNVSGRAWGMITSAEDCAAPRNAHRLLRRGPRRRLRRTTPVEIALRVRYAEPSTHKPPFQAVIYRSLAGIRAWQLVKSRFSCRCFCREQGPTVQLGSHARYRRAERPTCCGTASFDTELGVPPRLASFFAYPNVPRMC